MSKLATDYPGGCCTLFTCTSNGLHRKYIEYNIRQRKDEQLKDFMQKYENGERRMFAPHFGITKKEHNQMAYEAARLELEARRNQPNAPDKTLERSMGSP